MKREQRAPGGAEREGRRERRQRLNGVYLVEAPSAESAGCSCSPILWESRTRPPAGLPQGRRVVDGTRHWSKAQVACPHKTRRPKPAKANASLLSSRSGTSCPKTRANSVHVSSLHACATCWRDATAQLGTTWRTPHQAAHQPSAASTSKPTAAASRASREAPTRASSRRRMILRGSPEGGR